MARWRWLVVACGRPVRCRYCWCDGPAGWVVTGRVSMRTVIRRAPGTGAARAARTGRARAGRAGWCWASWASRAAQALASPAGLGLALGLALGVLALVPGLRRGVARRYRLRRAPRAAV